MGGSGECKEQVFNAMQCACFVMSDARVSSKRVWEQGSRQFKVN
jgi:hypothetical protein